MKFKPMTEEEIAMSGLLPAGKYMARVSEAEETTSAKGNDMIKLRLTVWDDAGSERVVYDYLLESMAFKLRHFCEAAKLTKQYEAGDLQAGHCEGREVTVDLVVETDKSGKYPPKNSVKDYSPLGGEATTKAANGKGDDDLPF